MYSLIDNQAVQIERLVTPAGYDLPNTQSPFPYYGALANDPNIPGLFLGNGVDWVSISGDVEGPVNPVVDGNLVAFDGTTGKIIKDSGYSFKEEAVTPFFLSSSGGYPNLFLACIFSKIGNIKTITGTFSEQTINADIVSIPALWLSDAGRIPADFLPSGSAPWIFPIIVYNLSTGVPMKANAAVLSNGAVAIEIDEVTVGAVDISFTNVSGTYY